ncbi:PR-1-like protein [Lojkania enalia]|uniref:PR-1-like protein n=1 Tax=Lojkania enalia TaxID=147567 RepID=A0A9P4N3W2_9PLEO|nr:PR-1-like protein [Didymosphaeria enalia]
MRSGLLLASTLAFGAIAKPLDKRYMVTEVEVEVKTVIVTVTAGQAAPTPESNGYGWSHWGYGQGRKSRSSKAVAPASSSEAPAPPPPSSTPQPIYTPIPEPVPTTTEVFTPPPAETEAPSSSSAAPAPSAPAGDHQSGEIQATFSSGPDYQAAILYHHNAARANHGAGPLVWDADCEAGARLAANTCVFEHKTTDGQGQNLFTNSGDSFNVTAAITESWYKGEFDAMAPYWGAANIPEDVFHSVGHLTQLLWKDTTKVGCVSIDCSGSMVVGEDRNSDMSKYTVCNYASAGNYANEYGNNVGAPISTTNLGSWLD